MDKDLAENGFPLGEAVIYGRLSDGNYTLIRISKDLVSLRDGITSIYGQPIGMINKRETKPVPVLFFQVLNGLGEQELGRIVKQYREREAEERNLGNISEEDAHAFELALHGYYDRYIKVSQIKEEMKPISIEEERIMKANLEKLLRDPFAEKPILE